MYIKNNQVKVSINGQLAEDANTTICAGNGKPIFNKDKHIKLERGFILINTYKKAGKLFLSSYSVESIEAGTSALFKFANLKHIFTKAFSDKVSIRDMMKEVGKTLSFHAAINFALCKAVAGTEDYLYSQLKPVGYIRPIDDLTIYNEIINNSNEDNVETKSQLFKSIRTRFESADKAEPKELANAISLAAYIKKDDNFYRSVAVYPEAREKGVKNAIWFEDGKVTCPLGSENVQDFITLAIKLYSFVVISK